MENKNKLLIYFFPKIDALLVFKDNYTKKDFHNDVSYSAV